MPLAIAILVWTATVVALIACWGVAVASDFYVRLHLIAPIATLSAACYAAAIWLEQGLGPAMWKALMVAVVLALGNAVLAHASARAARVRQFRRWVLVVEPTQGPGPGTAGRHTLPRNG